LLFLKGYLLKTPIADEAEVLNPKCPADCILPVDYRTSKASIYLA